MKEGATGFDCVFRLTFAPLREITYNLKPQSGPDHIKISRQAHAVVLSQIIKLLREVFIENLDAANRKAIAHPAIDAPVVKHFISNKQRKRQLSGSNRMLNLKPVAISRTTSPGISQASLKLIPIAEPELTGVEPQRDRQRQPILPDLAPAKRLHADVQVVRRHSDILSESESESDANTFVDRMADIASQTQRTENVEIKILRDRNRELNVGPQLIIGLGRNDDCAEARLLSAHSKKQTQ